MFELANKIALVTGASRGIGRATTQSLAKAAVHAFSFITAMAERRPTH